MRRFAVAVLALVALAARAQADDVYTWKDAKGVLHYSNAPVPRDVNGGLDVADTHTEPLTTYAPGEEPPAPSDSAGSGEPVSSATRKEMRQTQNRINEIDNQLATLARARTAHGKGMDITGGLGTNAAGVLSPEEQSLNEQRKSLVEQQEKLTSSRTAPASAETPPPEPLQINPTPPAEDVEISDPSDSSDPSYD